MHLIDMLEEKIEKVKEEVINRRNKNWRGWITKNEDQEDERSIELSIPYQSLKEK